LGIFSNHRELQLIMAPPSLPELRSSLRDAEGAENKASSFVAESATNEKQSAWGLLRFQIRRNCNLFFSSVLLNCKVFKLC
jgi:hypothetical protein